MKNATLVLIAAMLGLLVSPHPSTAQSKLPDGEDRTVNVAFVATDKHGKSVPRVTPSDLQILDNKKLPHQVLSIRGRNEVPLFLGMLIDNSGSQGSSSLYKAAVQAASEFPNQVLNSGDKAFFERFAESVEATQWLTKPQFLALRIDLSPARRTALYDAVRFACDERMKGEPARDSLRVIVLISDGEDNHSHGDLHHAVVSAQRAGTMIFTVDTGDHRHTPSTELPGDVTLTELAEQTGGTAFNRLSSESLPEAFASIKEQIANMYLLSYVVPDSNRNAQYHSFKLMPTSKNLKLRAPKGYYSDVPRE